MDMKKNSGYTTDEVVNKGLMTEDDLLKRINDFCRPLEWKDANNWGDQAEELFKDIL